MMTIGDREGRIFLSNSHTNNGLFFCLTIKYLILYLINMRKRPPPKIPEIAETQHHDVIFNITRTSRIYVRLFRFSSFPMAGTGM